MRLTEYYPVLFFFARTVVVVVAVATAVAAAAAGVRHGSSCRIGSVHNALGQRT